MQAVDRQRRKADSVNPPAAALHIMPQGRPANAPERRGGGRLWFGGPLMARRAGEQEALLLTCICAIDMYTTLWWVVTGQASESNENLAWTFDHNPLTFVLVKSVSCLPALLLAPRLARQHPKFTTWLLRGIILSYVGYYFLNIKF